MTKRNFYIYINYSSNFHFIKNVISILINYYKSKFFYLIASLTSTMLMDI